MHARIGRYTEQPTRGETDAHGVTMYLLLLLLVPVLYLFNSYLALVGLVAAIVAMYVQRTRPAARRSPHRAIESSEYKAGYEN